MGLVLVLVISMKVITSLLYAVVTLIALCSIGIQVHEVLQYIQQEHLQLCNHYR